MDNALGKCLFCLYSLVSILVFYQGVSVESQSYPLGHRMQSKVKCLRLEKPWHGKYIDLYNTPIEQPFLPLYTILWYSCDEGYELFPKNTLLICLRDGTWSQDPPTCSSKLVNNNVDFGFRKNLAEGKCQQLEEPAHGKYVDLFNSSLGQTYFPLNSILWYVCDKGYHLNPRNIILICLKDGSWSRDPPTCSTDCSLPKETGTCKDFKIKWHFDLEFGGCSTFWYGGCEGNENRFNSKDECESICVEPIGTGVCGLPRVSGPCVAQILAWYYDVGLNKCEPFNYSGCLGNNNNFHTRTACEDLCNIRAGLCPPLHSTTITKVRCFDNDNIEIKCDEATNNSSAKFECATYYELANRQLPIRHCWSGTWNLPPPLCIPVCGENNLSTKPVILNGTTVEKENYPWVAAVFKKTENGFINSCGGSMLTQKVILTAANCVANIYGNKLDESEFKVGVGKYYRKYKDERDTQAQYSDVQQIWVHPRYKGDSLRYSSDIAILVTKDTLSLSKVVQPVCFSNLPGIHLTARSEGMVTGWGIITPARGPSEELKSIAVPYKDDVACSKELPSDWLDKYNGYDKFCAGHHNKSIAVCMGDSGGGLVFKNPRDSRFYIHGIASLGRKLNNSGCDIQVSTLYTNVAVHYELLKEIISRKTSQ